MSITESLEELAKRFEVFTKNQEEQAGVPVIREKLPVGGYPDELESLLLKSVGQESTEFLDAVKCSVSENAQGLDSDFSCFASLSDSFSFRPQSHHSLQCQWEWKNQTLYPHEFSQADNFHSLGREEYSTRELAIHRKMD
jgi:hypothetical protein